MVKVRNSLREEETAEKKWNRNLYIILIVFILIVATVTYLFNSVYFHVSVVGPSMNPTLHDGDALVVSKVAEPKSGDIVIIRGKKSGGKLLIKRVIAVGGDSVAIKDGYVYKNGEKLIEKNYLLVDGMTYYPIVNDPTNISEYDFGVIPDGEYFFLGDNRRNSSDSRNGNYGTCSREEIIGVVSETAVKIKGVTKVLNEISVFVKGLFGLSVFEGE